LFASRLLALIKCLPPSLEALEVWWHPSTTILFSNINELQEALSENYSLTECTIGSDHYFKQIVERNKKLKEEGRFKRGKVALLGKNHEITREDSPPRKLAKH